MHLATAGTAFSKLREAEHIQLFRQAPEVVLCISVQPYAVAAGVKIKLALAVPAARLAFSFPDFHRFST